MSERLKDPKFWAMILTPLLAALGMVLNGTDWHTALGTAVSGLVAGLFGLTQPQSVGAPAPAPAVAPPAAPSASDLK